MSRCDIIVQNICPPGCYLFLVLDIGRIKTGKEGEASSIRRQPQPILCGYIFVR